MTYPARFRILIAAVVLALVVPHAAPAQTDRLRTVDPQAGRSGEAVTITGMGLGALNVSVTVGGVPASVVQATGNAATFLIPEGARPGVVPIAATNPGGRASTIEFRVLEGVLLQGSPVAPVGVALRDLRPTPAAEADVDATGVILTRIDVRLAPDATIGQLNAALLSIEGGVVGMQPGVLTVVVAVPRRPTVAGLQQQAALLASFPGIRAAAMGREAAPRILPFTGTDPVPTVAGMQKVQGIHHLLPSRFPAAWNAAGANQRLLTGCRRVPVIVQDYFGQTSSDWTPEFPVFPAGSLASDGSSKTHGFDVLTTIAANFDAGALTGANPFQHCLDLRPLSVSGVSADGITLQLSAELRSLPAGKAVVNQSIGFRDECDTCAPGDIPAVIPTGLERAYSTLAWKEATSGLWNDFALAVAAGNEANDPLSTIYEALSRAQHGWTSSLATMSDPLLRFSGQGGFYQPPASRPEFPSLAATVDELIELESDVRARGVDLVPAEFNVIIAGSTNAGTDPAARIGSAFSDHGADVHAVGECVSMSLDPLRCSSGTSFSSPQVAGLLSYVWLLSPELRNNRTSSVAVRAITENARPTSAGLRFLDAYATVLSLDAPGAPTPASAPIRVGLLDLNGNGSFTDADVEAFAAQYFDALDLPVAPTARDYSMFDLNGDGFTGGPGTDRFDLDRTGSTQFGPSVYGSVQFDIGGEQVSLSEDSVTDVQILCYYAYSPLYVGSAEARDVALANHCVPITVTLNPASVTLAPGATQQFAATVLGTPDPRVTWVLPNVGGTVSASGVFTAGAASGTYIVRAISVIDPGSFADASVTVAGAIGSVLSGTLTLHSNTDYGPGLSTDTRISVTLTAQPEPVEPGETPTFVVTTVSGSGTYTAVASSGCNRPPEVRSGTATSANLTVSPDLLVATLSVRFSGTSTHTSCTSPTTVSNFAGTLPDGRFVGTPIVVSGRIVAIDFNRSTTSASPTLVLVQTGRLIR